MFGFNPLYAACVLGAGNGSPSPSFSMDFLSGSITNTTFVRNSNATMFNSNGQLVWAPHNLVPNSSMNGAVLGVIGSGGALPTGWGRIAAAGITYEVTAFTEEFLDVRVFGTNSTGAVAYLHITPMAAVLSSLATESYTGQFSVQILAGSLAGFHTTGAGRLNVQWLNTGSYVSEAPPSAVATSSQSLLVCAGTQVASTNRVRMILNLTIPVGGVVDVTFRLGRPQLERTSVSSPSTYVMSSGSAYFGPRFDHHPATLLPRGLLVEGQRTNNCVLFADTGGALGGTNTASPSKMFGLDARRFTGDGTSVARGIAGAGFTNTATTLYTVSVYVRYVSAQFVQLTNTANGSAATDYANFDLTVGTVATVGATATASIQNCGDNLYRLQMSFTSIAAPTAGASVVLYVVDSGAATKGAANTLTTAVDFVGLQHEAGAFASSLMPTYGAGVTRSGDVADLINAPPWNPLGMTYAVQFERQGNPAGSSSEASSYMFYFGDVNTHVSGKFGYATSSQVRCDLLSAGVAESQVFVVSEPCTPQQVYRWAARLSPNDSRMAANTVLGGADVTVTMPSSLGTTHMAIGRGELANSQQLQGWLRGLQVYTQAFNDAQLQVIS